MLMIFPTLFDNYKVVGYEVIFLVKNYQNFFTIGIKYSKKSNSAVVFTRLACVDVGFGRRIALLDVFILKCVCFGAEIYL